MASLLHKVSPEERDIEFSFACFCKDNPEFPNVNELDRLFKGMTPLNIPDILSDRLGWHVEECAHPDVYIVNELDRLSAGMTPRKITNFHADELDLHIMTIEECGHPGIYIENNAYSSTGFKLPDYFVLMLVDNYDMAKFWRIFNELKAKYPVRHKVSLQEAMLGPSAESLTRIDEMRHRMHINYPWLDNK